MRQYGRGEKIPTRLKRMSSASVPNLPSGLVFSMRLFSPMVVPSTVQRLLLLDVRRGECATQTAACVCAVRQCSHCEFDMRSIKVVIQLAKRS